MAIRVSTSRAWHSRGKQLVSLPSYIANMIRFGWVNASYLVGLEVITKHQERALGAGSDWETFQAAISGSP